MDLKHWAHFDIAGVMDNGANAVPYLNKGMSGTNHLLVDQKGNVEALWETKHEVPVNAEKKERKKKRELASPFVRFFVCAHPPPPSPPKRGSPETGLWIK